MGLFSKAKKSLKKAASGAGVGALAGAALGPAGLIGGALTGGALGSSGSLDGISDKLFGSTKQGKASTLTAAQQEYLNTQLALQTQYAPQTMATLGNISQNPQSAYTELDPNYFQEAIANPYMSQRNQQWADTTQKIAGSGKFHSGAMTKQKSIFDRETSDTLSSQRQNFLYGERGLSMNAQENAYGRQMQALAGLLGQQMSPLQVQAYENYMQQQPGLLDRVNQLGSVAAMGKYLIS